MILTYSQYRELNNDGVDASLFIKSVIESLNEHGSLSYDEMVSLFEEVAEFYGYEVTDTDAYVQSLSSLLDSYVSESIDENDEYSYTLTDDAINEFFGPFKKKEPEGFMGHASSIIGGVAKAHGKAAAAGHKAGVKKQKNLMKHDYKMAKLSGKTAAGGFDNYAKLSSTANNRY